MIPGPAEPITGKIYQMQWFYCYVYLQLPMQALSFLTLIGSGNGLTGLIGLFLGLYYILTVIGLHCRKRWGLKLNWGVLALSTLMLPTRYRSDSGYWALLLFAAYIWFFPNFIYFRNRAHLFVGGKERRGTGYSGEVSG